MNIKINSNSQDRYNVSTAVETYMKTMSINYPQLAQKLKMLRSKLSNDLSCLC